MKGAGYVTSQLFSFRHESLAAVHVTVVVFSQTHPIKATYSNWPLQPFEFESVRVCLKLGWDKLRTEAIIERTTIAVIIAHVIEKVNK